MFWLWLVLLFLYGASVGALIMLIIYEEPDIDTKADIALMIGAVIFAPIALIIVWIGTSMDNETGLPHNILKSELLQKIVYHTVLAIQRRKDHKEMDVEEDNNRMERIGLKWEK